VSGRPFILKEDTDNIAPVSGFFGKWSASILAGKHWSELEDEEEPNTGVDNRRSF
jgi:hypothetical protein